MFVTVVKV